MPVEFATLVARYTDDGAREVFERLVAQLARLERADARQVALRHGDGGLDVIAGELTGQVEIWQAKFFHPKFRNGHQKKVEDSLARARKTVADTGAGGTISRWTLCVPVGLDGTNQEWWDKLVAAHAAHFECRLWDYSAFDAKLLSPAGRDIHSAYFEFEHANDGFRVAPPTTVATAGATRVGVAKAVDVAGDPAYVERDQGGQIANALTDGGFVVVSGDSAAGKSRTLLEALRTRRPNDEIAAPNPQALTALPARVERLRDGRFDKGLVVWLEDLDAFLREGEGLTFEQLDTMLAAPGLVVAATVRSEPLKRLRGRGGVARSVLERAEPILRLYTSPSVPEAKRFRVRHPGRVLGKESLGEHFLATRRLQERYEDEDDTVSRLVEVVIDWHRATANRPAPEQTVFELVRRRAGPLDQAELDEALGDATVAHEPGDRLLEIIAPGFLRAADYLVDLDDRPTAAGSARRPVAPADWQALLDAVDDDVAIDLAAAAGDAEQDDVVVAALENARRSSSPTVRAAARLRLGDVVVAKSPEEAIEHWTAALSGGDDVAVEAAERLLDRADEAEDVLDSTLGEVEDRLQGCGEVGRDRSDLLLARIALEREDVAELEEIFERLEHAAPELAARVGSLLGRCLHAHGDTRAFGVLEAAAEMGGIEALEEDALILAGYKLIAGQPDDAAAIVIEAVGLHGSTRNIRDGLEGLDAHFDEAGLGDLLLPAHEMLARHGESRSRSIVEAARNPPDDVTTREAAERHGDDALTAGDWLGAEQQFARASELGSPTAGAKYETASLARLEIEARDAEEGGDLVEAAELWEDAADRGVHHAAEQARRIRGRIAFEDAISFEARGDIPDPQLYVTARDGGIAEAAEHVARLAEWTKEHARDLEAAGRPDLAADFYEEAAEYGDEEAARRLRELRAEP
jgi:tetratricopeptide (TPR) repeat protein